jgi:lipid-binding SYLF domain-containing protein
MTRLFSVLLAVLLTAVATTATAATKLERRVDTATDILQQFTRIPEQGIPPSLLNNAYAVAVIPGVIKAGFMLGGSFGQGILVVRHEDGSWSNPAFLNLTAGSFGLQVGAQSSDIVLVFKSRRGVENIARGKFTLGGDLSVAAGPVGRYTSAATDLALKSEIYSYSRTRGLFGGISLEGAAITMDDKANFAYYQTGDGTSSNILSNRGIPAPVEAVRFKELLAATAPALQWQPAGSRTASAPRTPAPAQPTPDSGARTYGFDDAPPMRGDAVF